MGHDVILRVRGRGGRGNGKKRQQRWWGFLDYRLHSANVMLHTYEPGAAPAQVRVPQHSVIVFLPGS